MVARVGGDSVMLNSDGSYAISHYGSDILRPTYGIEGGGVTQIYNNKIAQGTRGTIAYFQLLTSYQPWHNIYIDAELMYRTKTGKKPQNVASAALLQYQSTFMFSIGLRMNFAYKSYAF
jgi:hypothetical protein